MCRRQGADSCGVRCENVCSTRVYLDFPAPLMLTPFNTLGNMWPETQGYADLTVNLLLSITNFHIDKLDFAFWERRFRNFEKGCEMGPCDSPIPEEEKIIFQGFPKGRKHDTLR